jgi:hypothetical protein
VIKASTDNFRKLKDEPMPEEEVIVVSNVDSTVQDSKEQDFVVMIELKFKVILLLSTLNTKSKKCINSFALIHY